jgi:hypothetical protein
MGVQYCALKIDSEVVESQIEKECMARDATLEKYLAAIRRMENYFRGFAVEYIERTKNTNADELAKAVAKKAVLSPDVFFQVSEDPSVKAVEPRSRMVNIIQGEDWRAPIMAYLHHHYEPDNSIELIRMQQRAKSYQVIEDELYKTSATGPLLRCLSKDEGSELLVQTHSGIYKGHIGSRALATKVLRQGFYWPSIIDDALKLVTTCQA